MYISAVCLCGDSLKEAPKVQSVKKHRDLLQGERTAVGGWRSCAGDGRLWISTYNPNGI